MRLLFLAPMIYTFFKFLFQIYLWRVLSHTWVRYPGFSGHGIKCPILTTVVPGFSGDLIGCIIRSKWGPFGDLYFARKKNRLCVWNMLFLGEINFPKGELVLWSLYGDKLSLCRNQQTNGKNLTIFKIMGLAETQWENLKQWGTDWWNKHWNFGNISEFGKYRSI